MSIKLKHLSLTNFRSWQDLQLTDLDTSGLTLIQGNNGSGKSSIRMAIEYLILDKTSDGLQVDDMPTDGKKNCVIHGVFDKDGQVIEITKYRNHSEYKNKTFVAVDADNSLTTNDRRSTQANIEKLFNVDADALFASTIFTKDSPSFVEALESKRKDLLLNVLPLDVYTLFSMDVQERLYRLNSDIEQTNSDLRDKSNEYRLLEQDLEQYQSRFDNFDVKKQQEILDLTSQLSAPIPNDLSEINELLDRAGKRYKKVDENELRATNDTLISIDKQISVLKSDIRYIEKLLNDYKNTTCPILNQECKLLGDRYDTAANTHQSDLDTAYENLKVLKAEYDSTKVRLDELNKDVEHNVSLDASIRSLEEQKREMVYDNTRHEEKLEVIRGQISEKRAAENPYGDMVQTCKSRLRSLAGELNTIEQGIATYNLELQHLEFLKKAYSKSGIPSMKADGFLEKLEVETNKYLSLIGDTMYVNILSQTEVGGDLREKIAYKVHSKNRSITSYKSYSGGERQRVKISDLFAFHKLTSEFDFLFLDEILEGSLDIDGKEAVISLLKTKCKEVGSLFVVSHDSTIQEAFNNIIKINIKNGVSYARV